MGRKFPTEVCRKSPTPCFRSPLPYYFMAVKMLLNLPPSQIKVEKDRVYSLLFFITSVILYT
jgi:hypothetical protein